VLKVNENNELYWEQKNPEYQETALGDLISAKDILDYDLIKAVQGGQLTKKNIMKHRLNLVKAYIEHAVILVDKDKID
jgi:hypothetical protein